MILRVQKTEKLFGKVMMPSSKSHSVRAILFALLARGESVIHNLLESDDTKVALKLCEAFGAKIENLELDCHENCVRISSLGPPFNNVSAHLDGGNSGISTTFFLPLIGFRADCSENLILSAGTQMIKRPMKSIFDALKKAGMKIEYLDKVDSLPVSVSGKFVGGDLEVEGFNSQYLSALLMSAFNAEQDTTIEVHNLQERPYVEMTLDWLKKLGIRYKHADPSNDIFTVFGGQAIVPFETIIPGDFSSASCFLAAGALLPGEIELMGLDLADKQGDKALIDILREMGSEIEVANESIIVRGGKPLQGLKIDAGDIPDLVPALAVLATQADGQTEIFNVKHARIKETDRIVSMCEGLRQMGAKIEEKSDGMIIHKSNLSPAVMKGCNDHRTIMALAVAGLLAKGESSIDTAEGIQKTFPSYTNLMQKLGAKMNLTSS